MDFKEEQIIFMPRDRARFHIKICIGLFALGLFFGEWPYSFRHLPFTVSLAYVLCMIFGLFFLFCAFSSLVPSKLPGTEEERERRERKKKIT